MKENKTASQPEILSAKTTLVSKNRVLARPNSLRPMKSLVKIKSLRPQLNIQVGTTSTKAAEKLA